jgi:hypothetical protein
MNEMERRTKLERLGGLEQIYVEVLYYWLQGWKASKVAEKLNQAEKTISARNTKIYSDLEVGGREELIREYSPIFFEFIKSEADLDNLGLIKAEMLRQAIALSPQSESVGKTTDIAASDGDAREEQEKSFGSNSAADHHDDQNPRSQETVGPADIRPRSRPPWVLIAGSLLVMCLVCIAGAVFARDRLPALFPQDATTPQATQTSEILVESTSTIEPSPAIQITETPLPTDTLTVTFTLTPPETITPVPTETKSPQGLTTGDELSDVRVSLRLREVKYNQGNTRVGQPVRIPIVFDFDFTNHSGQTLLLQVDQSNFRMNDDLGNEVTCEYWNVSETRPTLTQNVNDGQTIPLGVFCGRGDLPSQVKTYTLYVTGFSSLPDSTWVHKVVR